LVVRVRPGYTVDAPTLGPLVDANPGAMWLIGNEPDCIWQDNVYPEEYARIYHDLYSFIKNRDRTSQVAAGGIVQPTPLRLEYLDRVLAAYQVSYKQALPLDLWHIHNAVLNEQRGGWGAGIPPGIEADEGVLRGIDDNDNMEYFEAQVWAFRQWLADRGYSGYPLIITEFGVLLPDDYGYDVTRVNAFMSATFDFLSTAEHPTLGDPSDGHRLVQRWAWFSLDIPPWDPEFALGGFNGNLFDPETAAITAHGSNYASHTSTFPPLDYVDLSIASWQILSPAASANPTQTVTVTVQIRVANLGTGAVGSVVSEAQQSIRSGSQELAWPAMTVEASKVLSQAIYLPLIGQRFDPNRPSFSVELSFDGPASGTKAQIVAGLGPVSSEWLTFTLAGLPPGNYSLSARVDADGVVVESRECNNEDSTELAVPSAQTRPPPANNANGELPVHTNAAGTRGGAPPIAGQGTRAVAAQPFEEFPVPTAGSYPAQLAYDPGSGVLWVSERDGNKISRFDPGADPPVDPWTEFEIPTEDSQPWGLAVDGNGDVWFAESAADKIGRLELDAGTGIATFSEYDEDDGLSSGSQPWGVVVGGGAVWFTERAGDRIGKLDPLTGSVTEYPLPAGAHPGGIDFWSAANADYLWFAETGANRLGLAAFSKEGVLLGISAYFPANPANLVAPEDVAVNSVGNPWLTGRESNDLSLFYWSTTQGFYHVPVHTPDSEPYGIAVEGTSPIWFTERAGNKLSQYRSGALFEYTLPAPGSLPTDVVVDAAGCAWYTAPGSNRIGRLCNPQHHFSYLPLILRSWQD
jgi:streptogramin lyase